MTAAESTGGPGRAVGLTSGRTSGPASAPVPVDARTVAHLLPAARAAGAALAATGRSLSRDRLAEAMRDDGHGVSNERASLLLKILKAEQDVATISAESAPPRPEEPDPLSEVVAQPPTVRRR